MFVPRQQKRAEREQLIVEQAIALLVKKGFLGVRMVEVAKASDLSMGTIYSHFAAKEDLLMGCAMRLIREEKSIYQAIIDSDTPAMQRIVTCFTVNWLIAQHHSALVEIENLSLMSSVWTRAHPQRIHELNELHKAFFDMVNSVVLEILYRDLNGSPIGDTASQELATLLNHGMWGLCVGLNSTAQSGLVRSSGNNHQGICSYKHFTTNVIHFLKGYGWREEHPETVFANCRTQARDYLRDSQWFACQDATSNV